MKSSNNLLAVIGIVIVLILGFIALQIYQHDHVLLPDGSKPNPFASTN